MTVKRQALVDQRVAKALSHPLRAHVLAILNERVASPNDMAEQLGEPLGNVSYHVKALVELDCIELVSTRPRRGAVEHFYRAIARPYFSDRDWSRLPRSIRQAISDVGLQLIWDDVADSIEAGAFEARDDRILGRVPLVLDERGWGELHGLVAELLERTVQIEADAAGRLAESGEQGMATKLVMMQFLGSSEEKDGAASRDGAKSEATAAD
jgi:DNA-binding transcriptional ArsR family regulator